MIQHFLPAFLIIHYWPWDPHWEWLCCLLSFLVPWWSERLMVKCMPPPGGGLLGPGVWGRWKERTDLAFCRTDLVAGSSSASVVFRAFALALAGGWGVNILLHFGLILAKNTKMIYFCHFPLYLLLFLEIRLNGVARGALNCQASWLHLPVSSVGVMCTIMPAWLFAIIVQK